MFGLKQDRRNFYRKRSQLSIKILPIYILN